MAYVVPQVQIFQDFNVTPQAQEEPLAAHISGGHAQLIRYAESDEKQDGSLGQYSPSIDEAFDWPQRPAGGVVDQDYTKLFIDDALLHYYNSADLEDGDTVNTVVGYTNRVRAENISFATNGADFPHDEALLDRGAKVGDAVRLRATVDSEAIELCTHISGFEPEVVPAVTGAVDDDASNADAETADQDVIKLSGALNCVTAEIYPGSTYHGLDGGQPSEVYTIRVLQGSVDGDATTAVLRVTSESGTDDVAELSPAAFDGSPTTIGTRGVKVRFEVHPGSLSDCDDDAEDEGVSAVDFIAGQEWQVTASQTYTVPTVTIGGTYTGAKDDTYVVEIYRGAADDGDPKPQFTVRTVKGLDVSSPTTITAAATFFPAGTKGLTVSFSSLNLNKGDKWFVPVTAATDGAYQTLVLTHNLPDEILDNGETAVVVDLYIRKNIEVSANRLGFAPLTNWDQSETQITVNAGVVAFDDTWTDGGVPVALDVHTRCGYSNMFVEVRYWLCELGAKITEVGSVGELDSLVSGTTHPDNPLKYAALKALQNSNGIGVKLTAVCDPSDVDEWAAVLEALDGRDGVYGLVPLTKDPAVWSLFQAHVESQSSPENGHWRVLWLNSDSELEKAVVDELTSSDGEVVLAKVEDDPNATGTQYTQLRVPAHNGKFVTNGVVPGDIVRLLYTTDGFGGEAYDEFIVDAVLNEDTLRLHTGLDEAITVAERIEVWRTLSAAAQADEIALTAGYSDRRVRFVWPDEANADGFTVPGYHLCAALAGLVSGVVPHQGLTHVEINGFTSVPRTTDSFGRSHLNVMAEGGTWIVTQDQASGDIFSRHALTTAPYDNITEREESIVRNLDSISFQFLATLAPYIGVSNVVESTLELLRAEINGKIKHLTSSSFVDNLGSQLVSGVIDELRAHAVLRDHVVIALGLELPFPLNTIHAHLVLVA